MSVRVFPGATRRRRVTRLGDAYGRIVLIDAAAGYIHPALAAGYTRSGAVQVPQADGSLLNVGTNTVPREWDGSRWLYRYGTGFTQHLLRTTNFSNAAWSKIGLLSPVQNAQGPSGALDSWPIIENTAAGPSHWMNQSFTSVAGKPYTMLAIFSDRTSNRFLQLIQLGTQFGTNQVGCFDPRTGTFTLAGGCIGGMKPLGFGNWLCWISAVATAAATESPQVRLSNSAAAIPPTYTGDGVSGLNVYGAWCMDTAYLPPIANSAGSTTVIGAPSWAASLTSLGLSLPAEYTLGCDLVPLEMAGGYTTRNALQLDDGTNNERSALRLGTSGIGAARGVVITGGATVHSGARTAAAGLLRMAERVSAAAPLLACNGALDDVGGAITMPAVPTTLRVGNDAAGTSELMGGLSKLWVTRALSAAEMAACTA